MISTEPYHYDLTGHYANDLFIICMMSMIFTLVELKKTNIKIYNLNKKLIIAGFCSLIVANSIYPFSINFWSKTSAGTYNYKNYLNEGLTSNNELKQYLSLIMSICNLRVLNGLRNNHNIINCARDY